MPSMSGIPRGQRAVLPALYDPAEPKAGHTRSPILSATVAVLCSRRFSVVYGGDGGCQRIPPYGDGVGGGPQHRIGRCADPPPPMGR